VSVKTAAVDQAQDPLPGKFPRRGGGVSVGRY
jgi:hypothetical protein